MSLAVTVDIYISGMLQKHIEETVTENHDIKELLKSLKTTQNIVNTLLTTLVQESQSLCPDDESSSNSCTEVEAEDIPNPVPKRHCAKGVRIQSNK